MRLQLLAISFFSLGLCVLASSCAVGPDYQRPPLEVPKRYESATVTETAAPKLARDWWRLFGDARLDELETAALAANTDIQVAVGRVLEARATARFTAGEFFPVISADPTLVRTRTSANRPSGGGFQATSSTTTDIRTPIDLSYEVDIWGRVRRAYESAGALATASDDDLEVVQQTALADVAQDYFNIRTFDLQSKILSETIATYRRQLGLIEKQVGAGLATQLDLTQAQAQLHLTIAQETDVRRQRADLEHALAVLLGRPPSELVIAVAPLELLPPVIPAGLPSELLRRRPDVAEAEQQLVSAGALIGVADAAFYPAVTLTGLAGFESANFGNLIDWPSRIWSIGPTVTFPIFKGGQLTANLDAAKARYQEALATYRSKVLGAFQDVEDSLTDLHMRAGEAVEDAQALTAAREALRLSELRYTQGITSYLQVIVAQQTLLQTELSSAQILSGRFTSTVLLMKAVGGGWDAEAVKEPPS